MQIVKAEILDRYYYFLKNNKINYGKLIFCPKTKVIETVFIKKEYRKNNYATYLWNFVKKDLINENVKQITITTKEKLSKPNKLVNLYRSWGFVCCGKEYHQNSFRMVPMIYTFD